MFSLLYFALCVSSNIAEESLVASEVCLPLPLVGEKLHFARALKWRNGCETILQFESIALSFSWRNLVFLVSAFFFAQIVRRGNTQFLGT